MRNRPANAVVAACALILSGCGKTRETPPPPAAERPQVLRAIPTLERSILTDTTGAEDAEKRTYLVQAGFDSVAQFYRRVLPELGWRVLGDLGDSTRLNLHAVKGGPTIWVEIRRVGPMATEYTLIGSVTSAAAVPEPRDTSP